MSRARDIILDEIDNRRHAVSDQSRYQHEAEMALEDLDDLTDENKRFRTLLLRAQSLLNEFRDPNFSVSAPNVFVRIVELEAQIRAALSKGGDQ